MLRLTAGWLVGALVLAGVLVAVAPRTRAAEPSPLADTWKVTLLLPAQEANLWLVRLQEKDGKWEAEVLSSPLSQFKGAKVEEVRVGEDNALHLTVAAGGQTFPFVVHVPRGEEKPKKLLGSVVFRGQRQFARLERTDAKQLDAKDAIVNNPGFRDLFTALQKPPKDKAAALKEFADKNADNLALAYIARGEVLKALAATDASEEELRSAAEQVVKAVPDAAGPEMRAQGELQAGKGLVAKAPRLAYEYAEKAEKSLGKDAPAAQQAAALKVMTAALRKEGKQDEQLKDLTARLDRLEEKLDAEFEQNAIPFKVEPYAGRKEKGDRLVLVELFTGAQCPPCVAADIAFDSALQSYPPKDVAFLEYHEHIPGPDPLTTKDTETRGNTYYKIDGTPTVFIDGKDSPPLGGPKEVVGAGDQKFGGKVSYEKLTGKINDQLEVKPEAKLDLKVDRDGDVVTIHADASGVKKDAKDVRLRLVLAEEVVRYPGGNGQRLHHHVVRDMPGGVDGKVVEDGSARVEARVDLGALRKSLEEYLADYEKSGRTFADESRPLDLKHLIVVAFLQSDDSKEVLQSAQAEVGPGK